MKGICVGGWVVAVGRRLVNRATFLWDLKRTGGLLFGKMY